MSRFLATTLEKEEVTHSTTAERTAEALTSPTTPFFAAVLNAALVNMSIRLLACLKSFLIEAMPEVAMAMPPMKLWLFDCLARLRS